MKELVVISGKGGTGKTSLVASFAALAGNAVLADCDVDAADLHLILDPQVERRESFTGGKRARVMSGHCVACGKCEELCVFDAVYFDGPGNGVVDKTYRVDPIGCEGCGVCAWYCPTDAIEFKEVVCGQWFLSRTRFGPMAHARLGIAEENSGKLVSLVREQARELARREGRELVIIDGSPGIGCPVIASVTGASLVLVVTEPTLSGLHDLERVMELGAHFRVPVVVCVNKYDINPRASDDIERVCREKGVETLGRIRYDPEVTRAMVAGKAVVEHTDGPLAEDIREVWRRAEERLNNLSEG